MNTVLTGRAQDRHTAALRQVPTTQDDFLRRLRQSAPDWVWGCERCDMGFLNLEAPVFDLRQWAPDKVWARFGPSAARDREHHGTGSL